MTDEQPTLDATEAPEAPEAAEEKREAPEGHVVVRLVTELGEADVTVPPRAKWRSTARNRLSQGDDLGWAAGTLSDDDVRTWIDLDPVQVDVEEFFERFNKLAPEENRAARRAKQRGHLRAAS